MKKLLTLFVAVLASISITQAEVYSGTCGDNLTWSLNTEDSTLTIDGSGEMVNYPILWRRYNDYVKNIVIGSEVTGIAESAFLNCVHLQTVDIPDNVQKLGWSAFGGCTGLTSVTIGSGVKRLDYTFSSCTALTSITIPSTVDTIIAPFEGCTNLTAIHISDLAHWCNAVFTTSVYYYNNFIDRHLYVNGTEVVDLVIPDGVTGISAGAFCGAPITSLTIPASVTSIGEYAFAYCDGLKEVTVPATVTGIGDFAFGNVSHVVYSGTAEGAPWGARCANGYVEGWLIYKDNTKTELLVCMPEATGEIVLPDGVTTIGSYAFEGCAGITNIVLPESVTTIGNGAFAGCTGLPVIDNIRYADSYLIEAVDKTLTSYTLKDGIKWIGEDAFAGCENMTSFAIPDGITTINFGTFSNCRSLSSVTIPNSVKNIYSYAFYRCLGLDSIVIPAGVDTIEAQAFTQCDNLTTVIINSNAVAGANYPVIEQGYGYINGLINIFGTQVEKYIFGEGVTRIGDRAFYSNYSKSVTSIVLGKLSMISIPSTVTSIGEQAFHNCPLPFLYIPRTVTSIGDEAFKNMKMVAYKGSATGAPWGAVCYNEWCGSSTVVENPLWIDITDNSLADWDELPAEYVYTATCPNDASMDGLKSMKVFVDPTYINLLVDVNMDVVTDLEWVPFQIFIDADNSDETGGYSDQFRDANTDILLEGAIYAEGEPASYVPAVYQWWGEVGGSGWEWYDPSVSPEAENCWGALVCEENMADCGSQYVDGKFEIRINRAMIPVTWSEETIGIGCAVLQDWSSAGLLPIDSYSDENANGYTNKLKANICNLNHLHQAVIDGVTYILNDKDMSAQIDVQYYTDATVFPPYVMYNNQKYTVNYIGGKAFYGNVDLTAVTLPATIGKIGQNAFAYCMELVSITCEATVPPVLDENVFLGMDQTACVLYVPQASIELYEAAEQWGDFVTILPIAAPEAAVTAIEAEVTDNEVVVAWPSVEAADYYVIDIVQGGDTICTLMFDAQGQLMNVNYRMMARATQHTSSRHATQTASGWQYTIMGLEAGTEYTYSIRAMQGTSEIYTETMVFTTTASATGTEQVTSSKDYRKLLRNGQVLILRGDKVYTLTGQELR